MSKRYNNGGRIGKTVDYGSTDTYTTGSTNKKNSGIWNINSAVKEKADYSNVTGYQGAWDEGDTVSISIPVSGIPDGTTVSYSTSGIGITSGDFTSGEIGSAVVSNNALQVSPVLGEDATTEGTETVTVTFAATDSLGNPTGSPSITFNINDTSKAVVYDVTMSDTTVDENQLSFVFNCSVTNSTETLYWTINGTTSDFGAVSGSSTYSTTSTIGNDDYYYHSISVPVLADLTTEGDEEFTISLRSGSTSGTVEATQNFTVQDTSKTVSYSIHSFSDTTPDEGDTVNVEMRIQNQSENIYWSIDATTADVGVINGQATYIGSTTIGNDTYYRYQASFTVTADNTTEGNEAYTFRMRTNSTSGTVRDSQSFTIQDTSTTPASGGGGAGLSSVLATYTGQYSTSSYEYIDLSSSISNYVGGKGRLVFQYTSGTSFTGDIQLDNVNIGLNNYSFEASGDGWETTTDGSTTTTYTDAYYQGKTWSPVSTGTTSNRWNSDSGGTGSNGTGLTSATSGSYYLYVETSGTGYSNKVTWLRSPEVTLDTETLNFDLGRYGATIGTLRVFWEVTEPPVSGVDITSEFYEISNRFINSQTYMGSTTDYNGPYDVGEVQTDFSGGTGRIYIGVKVTSSTTYYNDVPIAAVQHLSSSGSVKNTWIFNSTVTSWKTYNGQISGTSTIGFPVTPATASLYSYGTINTSSGTGKFSLTSSTGSSYTGAADGIATTSSPFTVGDGTVQQSMGAYYAYRETSGSTLYSGTVMRSPSVSISPGDKIRVVHAVTGPTNSQMDPDDTLYVGVY